MMYANLNQGRVPPLSQKSRHSVISTDDPCKHAASLRNWSQEYIQLSPGKFSGSIVEASFGPVQVFRETIRQCIDEKANPRRDSYTLGVPVAVGEDGYWQGSQLKRDSLITLRPNQELYFRTPRTSAILVAVIDCASFDAFAQNTSNLEILPIITQSNSTQALTPRIAQHLRATFNNVLTSIISRPDILDHPASVNEITETVMDASLRALQIPCLKEKPGRNTHSVQRAIVERAREYIIANHENPLTVAELSAHMKMSRRGLHHAFINVVGINTMTYLRYVRLHGVKKSLLNADPGDSVSEVAFRWGFWHLGMFSSYYKTLFGELPSVTLQKALNSL